MVQKEIFQAGLGDVDVAQFDAAARSQAGDLRNERTPAVSVEVGAASRVGADFPDAGEALETFEEIRGVNAKAEAEQVAAGNGILQLLGSSQGDDAAVIYNRKTLTEGVGFFHVVSGQQNRFAALVVFADDLPQKQTGLRVQAGAGLVEEKDLRVVHHGAGDRKALHHAAGEAANHLVGVIGELEAFEEGFGALGAFVRTETEIGAVEDKNFACGKREIKIRALGYHADQALDGDLFLPDIVLPDERLAGGWADPRGEDADSRRLAGAVGAEQSEDFSRPDVEGNSVKRYNLRLGLFGLGFGRAEREAARARRHGGS